MFGVNRKNALEILGASDIFRWCHAKRIKTVLFGRKMKALHIHTPLWESVPLSMVLGAPVLLKMEALQPVGSFKIRGMGHICQARCEAGATHLVCASGGNAGHAVAYAGRQLGVDVTIVVPKTTPEWTREMIRREGAEVVEHGEAWDDSHAYAFRLAQEKGTTNIHPFDDPLVWSGHASLVQEVAKEGPKPGVVVVSVGGGGLLIGILTGLHQVGWSDVPVVAVETHGTDSFASSVAAGRLVTLDAITSIATTLGARTVAAEALAWTSRHSITPWVVSDRAAVDACLRFADDHRILVEPACGAALATVYDRAEPLSGKAPVLVIVCGGAGASLALLSKWDSEATG
jgi:L-serine/L-threonine ammonia-lyase